MSFLGGGGSFGVWGWGRGGGLAAVVGAGLGVGFGLGLLARRSPGGEMRVGVRGRVVLARLGGVKSGE